MAEQSLDAINFASQDAESMYSHLKALVPNFKYWWQQAQSFPLPAHYIKAKNIVLCGMGGSAQASVIVKDLAQTEARVPIEIVRDYNIPNYVDRQTLLIAVSYSGTTEETINTYIDGFKRQAMLLGIGTGAQIAALSRKYRVPYFEHNYVSQPRAALGVHLAILVNVFARFGLLNLSPELMEELDKADTEMQQKWSESIPESQNEAKQLARKMYGRVPVIIGSGVLAGVANRMKANCNENAKTVSYFEVMPEMNHNALIGTEQPKHVQEWMQFLLLDSQYTHDQNKTRMILTEQLLAERRFQVQRCSFDSSSPLQEVIKALLFSDLVSYYLAILNQVNPSSVDVINSFKERLSK